MTLIEGPFVMQTESIEYDGGNAAAVITAFEGMTDRAQNGYSFVSGTVFAGNKIRLTNSAYDEIMEPGMILVRFGSSIALLTATGANSWEVLWRVPPAPRIQIKSVNIPSVAAGDTDTITVNLPTPFRNDKYNVAAEAYTSLSLLGVLSVVGDPRVIDEDTIEVDVHSSAPLLGTTGILRVQAIGY